jgi:DNA-binding transcriptional regulator YhcF (GntR family)
VRIEVDPASPVPAYRQIRQQIEGLVASGALGAGARLPTIRQLAADLGLARNTVARVYRELEAAGVVVTGARTGTVVAADPPRRTTREIQARVRAAADAYLSTIRALGLSTEDAVAALRRLD